MACHESEQQERRQPPFPCMRIRVTARPAQDQGGIAGVKSPLQIAIKQHDAHLQK